MQPGGSSSNAAAQVERRQYLRSKLLVLALGLLAAFWLNGCVTLRDPEASQEYNADRIGTVQLGQTLGQTFLTRRQRLNQVELWLRRPAESSPDGRLIIELFHNTNGKSPIASMVIAYRDIDRSYPVTIHFPPQQVAPGVKYFLRLSTTDGPINVYGRAENAYPTGKAWQNNKIISADMAFRTGYDYDARALLNDLQVALKYTWLVIPLLLTLWLPGATLLRILRLEKIPGLVRKFDPGERFGLAMGLSLALIPLLMLWTSTFKIRWTQGNILGSLGILSAAWLWLEIPRWRSLLAEKHRLVVDWNAFALLAIFVFSLGVRLIMVRDLAGPAWVDSVHHATITRMIMDEGVYPENYAPYAKTDSARYHPGFHSATALFLWLSGMDLPGGMLVFGQVLNALIVVAAYLFTTTLTNSRMAGLAAALFSGVFSPMPAYYASWGRYTQLAGLLVLPACLALLLFTLQIKTIRYTKPGRVTMIWFGAGLACGGLFMVHYRVVFFLALLLFALVIADLVHTIDKYPLWQTAWKWGMAFLPAAGIGIAITLPWWPGFLRSMIAPQVLDTAPAPNTISVAWGLITPAFGRSVLFLAGIGLTWSIIRLRWYGPTLALWIALLYVSTNPGLLGIPFGQAINQTSVEIMLFLPLATLGGALVGDLEGAATGLAPGRWKWVYHTLLASGTLLLALVGARSLLPILNPVTLLLRQADGQAMVWIEKYIPKNETILINPFLWGYGFYAGQDGGYWIAPLAKRKTMPPSLLYAQGNTSYYTHVNEVVQQVIDKSKDPIALHKLLWGEGIHFVYIGRRGGALSPQLLHDSPLFTTIHRQDGTWVFQLNPP